MKTTQIFGKIISAHLNKDNNGTLLVHAYSGNNFAIKFANVYQLGNLHLGDALLFTVYETANHELILANQFVDPSTLVYQLQQKQSVALND